VIPNVANPISPGQEILGWQAKVSMEEGLLKTIPYFKTKLGL